MREFKKSSDGSPIEFNPIIGAPMGMRELLISDLSLLKISIQVAETEVFTAYKDVQDVKCKLQLKEDAILMDRVEGIKIDGKNAEIRAAQVREATAYERLAVQDEEKVFEERKLELANLKTELRINLALVELVKEVA